MRALINYNYPIDECIELFAKYKSYSALAFLYEKQGSLKKSLLNHMKV